MVALQPVEPVPVAPHSDQVRLRLLGEPEEVLGVAPPQLVGLADSSRRSTAYSRIVSSIVNRGSSSAALEAEQPAVGQRREPVDESRSSPQTLSAASSVQPPANTASRTNSRCSSGSSRLVAPVDRRAERLLALGQVARRRR